MSVLATRFSKHKPARSCKTGHDRAVASGPLPANCRSPVQPHIGSKANSGAVNCMICSMLHARARVICDWSTACRALWQQRAHWWGAPTTDTPTLRAHRVNDLVRCPPVGTFVGSQNKMTVCAVCAACPRHQRFLRPRQCDADSSVQLAPRLMRAVHYKWQR